MAPDKENVAPDNKGNGQSNGDPPQDAKGQSAAANKPAAAKLAAAGDNTLLMLVPAIAILSIVLVVASKMHLRSRK